MTWTCPNCGRIYMSENEMRHCPCRGGSAATICPDCGGTGKIVPFFGPAITCTRCGGSGKINGMSGGWW